MSALALRSLVKTLALLVGAACTAGCGSAYTSIRPLEDGSYLLTENAAGFIRISGAVYRCTPQGEKLVCKEVSNN
jgi:hypothetical protein